MSARPARSRLLLVDLDGTLIDPAEGIIASFQHALGEAGVEVPPADQLGWVIGPPLRKTFPRYVPEDAVERAVASYRTFFGGGAMFRARVYDGVPQALDELRQAGWTLAICTVKPRVFARPLAERLGLSGHFDEVYGAELDGRFDDKAELIEHILAERRLAPDDALMVGDRDLDVIAAGRNRMRAIGVTWGYGTAEELHAARAARLCHAPSELPGAAEAARV